MTSTSPTDHQPETGLLAGRWIPHQELRLPIDDVGFRQGAAAVERLRTYNGNIFQLSAHLDRWQETVEVLGLEGLPLRSAIEILLDELIGRNRAFAETAGDFGITMFATPGRPHQNNPSPTFGMHLNPIDHAANRRRGRQGQPLVITQIAQPSDRCWPRHIKVRTRLHYYLADQIASQQHPDALGVLVDDDGSITETSVANLAMVRGGSILSPLPEQVLGGITQQIVRQLASELSIPWTTSSISSAQLADADEILLMGTDGGLWFARSVDDKRVSDGGPGEVYRRLRARFDEFTG